MSETVECARAVPRPCLVHRPVPPDGVRVECRTQVEVDSVTIGAFDRGVDEKPVPLVVRAAHVAAAAANEGTANVTVQENGLLRTMHLVHVEDEQVRFVVLVQFLPNIDHDADLVPLP